MVRYRWVLLFPVAEKVNKKATTAPEAIEVYG